MGARVYPKKSVKQPSPAPSPATRAEMGVGTLEGDLKTICHIRAVRPHSSIPSCPSSICSSPENITFTSSRNNVSVFLSYNFRAFVELTSQICFSSDLQMCLQVGSDKSGIYLQSNWVETTANRGWDDSESTNLTRYSHDSPLPQFSLVWGP